jgi:hypothetical protein
LLKNHLSKWRLSQRRLSKRRFWNIVVEPSLILLQPIFLTTFFLLARECERCFALIKIFDLKKVEISIKTFASARSTLEELLGHRFHRRDYSWRGRAIQDVVATTTHLGYFSQFSAASVAKV